MESQAAQEGPGNFCQLPIGEGTPTCNSRVSLGKDMPALSAQLKAFMTNKILINYEFCINSQFL